MTKRKKKSFMDLVFSWRADGRFEVDCASNGLDLSHEAMRELVVEIGTLVQRRWNTRKPAVAKMVKEQIG